MKVDKVNLSTVPDDEITSRDCGNNTIPGEADVVNGSGKWSKKLLHIQNVSKLFKSMKICTKYCSIWSGNAETEESEREKGEAMKTISVVEDCKIVKEKANETEKDETESFNKEIEDAKIILSGVTLETEKEDNITGKPKDVSIQKAVTEEDQTETIHSPEHVEEIGNISKILIDTTPVKVDENDIEKSLNLVCFSLYVVSAFSTF